MATDLPKLYGAMLALGTYVIFLLTWIFLVGAYLNDQIDRRIFLAGLMVSIAGLAFVAFCDLVRDVVCRARA